MHKAVIGLGYGDETKGANTSFLATQEDFSPLAVVRFNGGAQAAHNVVLEDGTHHTFSQFGSGTLQGIPTILSRFMLVNPVFLFNEAQALQEKTGANPYYKLLVSENALVTTYLHVLMNRHREKERGQNRHGSVGLGIGETVLYSLNHPEAALRVRDLRNWDTTMTKLQALAQHFESEGLPLDVYGENYHQEQQSLLAYTAGLMTVVEDAEISQILTEGDVLFEGAQGVLLDERYGFHPYTTWSSVTRKNIDILLEEADAGPVHVYGAIRSYHTRHGAGPMPSELEYTPELAAAYLEPHNHKGEFQGGWRIGMLDLPLLNYALEVCEVDELSVSHLDYPQAKVVESYPEDIPVPIDRPTQIELTEAVTRQTGKGNLLGVNSQEDLLALIEESTGKKVAITSHGPTSADRHFR